MCMCVFSCHGNVVTCRGDDGDGRSGGDNGDGIVCIFMYMYTCSVSHLMFTSKALKMIRPTNEFKMNVSWLEFGLALVGLVYSLRQFKYEPIHMTIRRVIAAQTLQTYNVYALRGTLFA